MDPIKPKISAETFIKSYAKNAGRPVTWLMYHHYVAVPCVCGHERCPGWQMLQIKIDYPQFEIADPSQNVGFKTVH